MNEERTYPRSEDGCVYVENGLLKTEIDRLRGQIDELAERYNAAALEATRLQAEIVQFKHALEMQQHTEMGLRAEKAELKQCADAAITDKFKEIAKVERLRAENEKMMNRLRNPELTWAENNRLRAENAELRQALHEYGKHTHSCRRHTYPLLEPKECDCGWSAILAKTLKEGE